MGQRSGVAAGGPEGAVVSEWEVVVWRVVRGGRRETGAIDFEGVL